MINPMERASKSEYGKEPSAKSKNSNQTIILTSHEVGASLPMNTKYLSGNLISRILIRGFVQTITSLAFSTGPSGSKFLDIGCGEGIVTRQLRRLWPSAIFHGLDIAPELLSVACRLLPDISFMTGSVYTLPFADYTYDMVFCTEVLEHLENPYTAVSEISRIGKNFFIFSVPNEPWWRIANMARGAYWQEWGNSPGHLNHWTSRGFGLFLSNFFEIMAIKQPFPWTIVLCRKK